jgi:Zinc-finger of C2H2 type
MTCEQLDRLVVRADTNNYITNPVRLLPGPLGRYEPPATTVTLATERSWNALSMAYECFLCHKTFNSLPWLNQHLQSPVHQDKIYKCPKSDWSGQDVERIRAGGTHFL